MSLALNSQQKSLALNSQSCYDYPTYNSPDDWVIHDVVGHDSSDNLVIHMVVGHESSQYATIFSYLRDQIIPDNLTRNKKFQLIRNASPFTLAFGDFYRKSLEKTILRCLEKEESKKALVDIHDGIGESHSNGLVLA